MTNQPNDPKIIAALGKSYIKLNQLQEASSILESGVKMHPLNAEFHHNLGVVHSLTGNLSKAEIHLRKSFSLNELNENTAFKLAILFAAQDPPKINIAKEWYFKAIHLGAPKDEDLERFIFE